MIRAKVREHTGKSFVVVSHGDPIMSVALRYEGKPLPRKFTMNAWYVPMASGFQIEFDQDAKTQNVIKLPLP